MKNVKVNTLIDDTLLLVKDSLIRRRAEKKKTQNTKVRFSNHQKRSFFFRFSLCAM